MSAEAHDMQGRGPSVHGSVTVYKTVEFRDCLDGWTLAELETYLEGDDDEGREYMASDSYVIGEEVETMDYSPADLKAYVEWRRQAGLKERLA